MIAYDSKGLKNETIQEEAATAYAYKLVSKEEYDMISSKHPVPFYTPNFFIRVGLFLLTLVIVCFSFGFFCLVFMSGIENIIEGLAIFFALVMYGVLEYLVKEKKHYQSGVDDALLWFSAAMLFGGISFAVNAGAIGNCLLTFFISLFAALRFADRIMSLAAYLAMLGFIFFTFDQLGGIIKATLPFILITTSALIYWVVNLLRKKEALGNYCKCFSVIRIAALLSFYAAGNFYVVKELSNKMYHLPGNNQGPIPFEWLFWILTFIIPLVYLIRGIQKKDMVFLRTGMLLVAALVFTVRYYYAIVPTEVAMIIGGILLLVIAYAVIQYLKQPKFGFTYADTSIENKDVKLQLESIVITETFGEHTTPVTTKFGGGSFGGGGASGDF